MVIARFYGKNGVVITQPITVVQVLNLSRLLADESWDLDTRLWIRDAERYQIWGIRCYLPSEFERVVVHPPSSLFWKIRSIVQTGINPRHKLHRLSLLPSGSDEVRDRLLRGVRSKWFRLSKNKTLGREFSPA